MATGIFVCTVAAFGLNYFLNIGFSWCTSRHRRHGILNNPVATGAVPGALLLFAGLFNVFVGVLNLLLRILAILNGRRR